MTIKNLQEVCINMAKQLHSLTTMHINIEKTKWDSIIKL